MVRDVVEAHSRNASGRGHNMISDHISSSIRKFNSLELIESGSESGSDRISGSSIGSAASAAQDAAVKDARIAELEGTVRTLQQAKDKRLAELDAHVSALQQQLRERAEGKQSTKSAKLQRRRDAQLRALEERNCALRTRVNSLEADLDVLGSFCVKFWGADGLRQMAKDLRAQAV